jgi:hypothetical protein
MRLLGPFFLEGIFYSKRVETHENGAKIEDPKSGNFVGRSQNFGK